MIPLSDGAGEVVAVGSGVTRVRTGTRVIGAFMQKWISGEPAEDASRSALGGHIDGVGAEYVVLSEQGVVQIPDYLSYEEAATLPCAAVTVWNALITGGHLRPDETVLVQGTGGVSLFALQFALNKKAHVIATSSSPAKIARLTSMGAQSTINYAENPEWHKQVRELTGGSGVDHVVEVGGSGTLPKSLKAVRTGGKVHMIGILTGPGDIDVMPVLMRSIRLQGVFVGSREMAEDMLREMSARQIRPVIDRVFPFTDAVEALRHMESGSHFGKIVLAVPGA